MPQAKRRIVLAVTLAEHGGVQEFLLRFAKYLQVQGHEVTILAGEGTWLFEKCVQEGIPSHKLKHMRRALHPWHDILAVQELKRYLQKNRPDAIHLNSSKMGAIGSLAARKARIPRIVYRIGGWVFLEPLSPFTCWLYKTIERVSAPWKDTIICVHPGDEQVARAENIVPRGRLTTIPNGIDLETFDKQLLSREAAREALGIHQEALLFGTIANLFPAKDLPRYLEACKKIHELYPQTRFLILGEGAERLAIETKRAQLNLTEIVSLPGLKPNASQFLKGFDAFVLPSAKEGMSWALLEAMAARIPCVATDVGANKWLLDDNAGWIVPTQNTQDLVDAMQTIILNPLEASRRAKRAHTRIETAFPLKETLQKNLDALL